MSATTKRFALLIGVVRADGTFTVLDTAAKASQLTGIEDIDPAEISQYGILKDVILQKKVTLAQPVASSPVPTTGALSVVSGHETDYIFNVNTTQAGGTTRYTVGSGVGVVPADPTTGSTVVADNAAITVALGAGKKVKMRTFGPTGYLPSAVITKTIPA